MPLANESLNSLMERADRNMLIRDAQRVLEACAPAADADLGRIIFQLLIMYPEFDRRAEASKSVVVAQWRQSLTGWPKDVLERAAQGWINGDKAAFAPQPGDILAHCQRLGAFRKAMAKKAKQFLELTGDI